MHKQSGKRPEVDVELCQHQRAKATNGSGWQSVHVAIRLIEHRPVMALQNAWTSAERHWMHGTLRFIPRAERRLPGPPRSARGDRLHNTGRVRDPKMREQPRRQVLTGNGESYEMGDYSSILT